MSPIYNQSDEEIEPADTQREYGYYTKNDDFVGFGVKNINN
jgi:hypothetical protein